MKQKVFLTIKEQYELVYDELKRLERSIRTPNDFHILKHNIMLLHEMMLDDLKELQDKKKKQVEWLKEEINQHSPKFNRIVKWRIGKIINKAFEDVS